MLTPTHVLLACAALVPKPQSQTPDSTKHLRTWVALSAIVGALIPDASMFVMWGVAKVEGVADAVLWRDWYFSATWQKAGAVTNSIPLFVALMGLAWAMGARLPVRKSKDLSSKLKYRVVISIFAASTAALLHALTDLPLHHKDGHPHFWPFSDWIFASPVSYWDPQHYGRIWMAIEACLAAALLAVPWRNTQGWLPRACLIVTALGYAAVAALV